MTAPAYANEKNANKRLRVRWEGRRTPINRYRMPKARLSPATTAIAVVK
jgi:hypothetical protein